MSFSTSFNDIFWAKGGPWGLSTDFVLNLATELIGLVLGAIFFTFFLEGVRSWRQKRMWKPSRRIVGDEMMANHAYCMGRLSQVLKPSEAADEVTEELSANAFETAAKNVRKAIRDAGKIYQQNGFALTPQAAEAFAEYLGSLDALEIFVDVQVSLSQGFGQRKRRKLLEERFQKRWSDFHSVFNRLVKELNIDVKEKQNEKRIHDSLNIYNAAREIVVGIQDMKSISNNMQVTELYVSKRTAKTLQLNSRRLVIRDQGVGVFRGDVDTANAV